MFEEEDFLVSILLGIIWLFAAIFKCRFACRLSKKGYVFKTVSLKSNAHT